MTDLSLSSIDAFRDQLGIWAYETEINDLGSSPEAALVYAARQNSGQMPHSHAVGQLAKRWVLSQGRPTLAAREPQLCGGGQRGRPAG